MFFHIAAVTKRMRCAVMAACYLNIAICAWGTAPAGAQSASSCEVNDLTRLTLNNLKAADEKVQIAAGRSLIENWRSSIPGLIGELQQLKKDPESWSASELKQAILLTDIVKAILSTSDQSIALFRQCDNDKVVKALAWLARGSDKTLRINTANILANTVDNTTICIILRHLQDRSISTNGRANFLGVTVAVASYAYKENIEAINTTLKQIQQDVLSSKDDLAQTQQLMIEIAARALKSSNANTPLPDSLKDYCRGFKYSDPLD